MTSLLSSRFILATMLQVDQWGQEWTWVTAMAQGEMATCARAVAVREVNGG